MSLRVILLDIDGTLTNSQKIITPKTREALLSAQNRGCTLVLASGRPTPGLGYLAKELEMDKHHGILLSFNGACVSDFQTGEVFFDQSMTVEEGQAVLRHMANFPELRPMVAKDDYLYVQDVYSGIIQYKGSPKNIMEYEARMNHMKLCEVADLAEFASFPLHKILTAASPEYLQAHFEEMRAPFQGKLSCMFTADFYYEFTAQGINKATALRSSLLPLGYRQEEMIAFGDAENDAPMLEFAGIGVAMGNATDALKAMADEVTLSNDEDGIAYTLHKYDLV
jgi:hypothetical protein